MDLLEDLGNDLAVSTATIHAVFFNTFREPHSFGVKAGFMALFFGPYDHFVELAKELVRGAVDEDKLTRFRPFLT
ncbi:hypothetical protein [Mucilaginibacter sp.]|uniref:hypothetical protein n=1 Tax=Mucilaginibacter sp. TaxID=1882438 RepID=UPI002626BF8F|nr:hypothetical protein [Mucilaginibacter sp.]